MIFVGDRYLTDVVYGNRHGMFTVRVEPFTEEGESSVDQAREEDRGRGAGAVEEEAGEGEVRQDAGVQAAPADTGGEDGNAFVGRGGAWVVFQRTNN